MHLRRTMTLIGLLFGAASAASTPPSASGQVSDPQGIAQIAPGEVLVLGEVHGSRETPAAFVALVDRLLARSKVVSVGLEMPPNASLANCPGVADAELGRFWTRKTQDGRSSEAMRDMVCQLKKRVAAGRVRLHYLDSEPRRYEEMVRRVSTQASAGSSLPMAVLIGNFHARNAADSFVGRIRAQGIKVTSLTASSPDATTWNCTRDGCSARPMPMNFCPGKAEAKILLVKAPADSRWDGCLVLPRLTSSPPATAAT